MAKLPENNGSAQNRNALIKNATIHFNISITFTFMKIIE